MSIRTYSELITLPTFGERFEYLKLNGVVGEDTFGKNRFLNQLFYQDHPKWKAVRREVINRDLGWDLGVEGIYIPGMIIVHHMNPITLDDLENESDFLLNPEYLISTSHNTHNAIHYGDVRLLITAPVERTKNDTCPWRR